MKRIALFAALAVLAAAPAWAQADKATAPLKLPAKAEAKGAAPVAVKPRPRPVDFVSEVEVRAAMRRKEKILVGKKTVITPLARDLAAQYDVLGTED